MSTILSNYNIQFLNRIINNRSVKLISSISEVLNQFIADFKTSEEVNDFLLPGINNVLNGSNGQETIISESMVSVQISITVSNFYQDPDYDPSDASDFSMPTQDLKTIAEAWLNYISAS